jgi:hypothetical protein
LGDFFGGYDLKAATGEGFKSSLRFFSQGFYKSWQAKSERLSVIFLHLKMFWMNWFIKNIFSDKPSEIDIGVMMRISL